MPAKYAELNFVVEMVRNQDFMRLGMRDQWAQHWASDNRHYTLTDCSANLYTVFSVGTDVAGLCL